MISMFFNKEVNSHSLDRDEKFLKRHALMGQYQRMCPTEEGKTYWKKQVTQNLMVRRELEILSTELKGKDLPLCLLKGFALMGDLYQDWGERFASDVDVLVSVGDLWRLKDILVRQGFEEVRENKWKGNRFKSLFRKRSHGVPVTVEVHTQLFWHTEINWQAHLVPSMIDGLSKLKNEVQLLHLCGHYGFQHTFIKLFWLVDIHRFLQKYEGDIHWASFWNLASGHNLYRSCYGIMAILDRLSVARPPKSKVQGLKDFYALVSGGLKETLLPQASFETQESMEGDRAAESELAAKEGSFATSYRTTAPQKYSWTRGWVEFFATNGFLSHPRRYPFRYFLLKNLLKDSFYFNRVYWVEWFRNKVSKRKSISA